MMKELRIRVGGVAAVVGVTLFVAACGSSSSSSSSAPPASSSPYSSQPSSQPAASSGSVVVGTAKGPMGTYLTGASGRALYLWVADSHGKSSCSGACAKVWSPLVATSTPSAKSGINGSQLGMITRADGKKQVTYNGHPLYYFSADPRAGSTKGQGNSLFGAKWWLVAPSGAAITAATTASTSGSSSGYAGGSSSSSSSGSSGGSAWG